MNTDREFVSLALRDGVRVEVAEGLRALLVQGWREAPLSLPGDATHFGMVTEGEVAVTDAHGTIHLTAGMYFVLPGPCQICPRALTSLTPPPVDALARTGGHHERSEGSSPASTPLATGGLVITCPGYRGVRQFGGPPEGEGRLRYIDGCSDTLLVCPPRRGEPCLNFLHLPPCTTQSAHTHPSERIGVVLRGRGECRTPAGVTVLTPGMGWRIPTGCRHAFVTKEENLDILAWHPDSDFGPTDQDHPMLNRTIPRPR